MCLVYWFLIDTEPYVCLKKIKIHKSSVFFSLLPSSPTPTSCPIFIFQRCVIIIQLWRDSKPWLTLKSLALAEHQIPDSSSVLLFPSNLRLFLMTVEMEVAGMG